MSGLKICQKGTTIKSKEKLVYVIVMCLIIYIDILHLMYIYFCLNYISYFVIFGITYQINLGITN